MTVKLSEIAARGGLIGKQESVAEGYLDHRASKRAGRPVVRDQDDEPSVDAEPDDEDYASVEDMFHRAHADYVHGRYDREATVANLRGALDHEPRSLTGRGSVRHAISDDELLAAAKDVHDRRASLHARYRQPGKTQGDVSAFIKRARARKGLGENVVRGKYQRESVADALIAQRLHEMRTIKLGVAAPQQSSAPPQDTPTHRFMKDYWHETQGNPIDHRQRIHGGGDDFAISELRPHDGNIHISWLQAVEPGRGQGKAALAHITRLADKHGVHLTLAPSRPKTMRGGGLSTLQLRGWYGRRGFKTERGTGGDMIRAPKSSVSEAAHETHMAYPLYGSAYGGMSSADSALTHIVPVDERGFPAGETLCKKAKAEHVMDDTTQAAPAHTATCRTCRRRHGLPVTKAEKPTVPEGAVSLSKIGIGSRFRLPGSDVVHLRMDRGMAMAGGKMVSLAGIKHVLPHRPNED